MKDMVFIPHNTPSLKNGKIATKQGVFSSKAVQNYLRSHGIKHYSSHRKEVDTYKTLTMTFPVEELKMLFKEVKWPVEVGLHFVRNSRRKFDFINVSQVLFDLFTAFDIIPDDNMDYVIPRGLKIENKFYSYDRDNPGVWIKIIKDGD